MPVAKIDDNRVRTVLGWDDTNSVTEPLQVATASGRLLLDLSVVTSTTPGALTAEYDDIRVPLAYAVSDDANETITPLMIDARNGVIFIDLVND